MDNRSPVVVIYHGNQGALGIARTLGRLGVPMYLVAQDKMPTPLSTSRYWSAKAQWDFGRPEADSVEFLVELSRKLRTRHGARPVLLTAADWAAIFIESHADELEEHFAFPNAPTPVVHRLVDKWSMNQLAAELGIPTPETVCPQSRDDVAAYVESARFPVVVKATDSFREHVPASTVARTPADLLDKYDREAALGPPNMIFQEYIPGDATSVWMCNAYFDRDGRCRAIFTGQKLRQLSSTGIATLAVCVENETVARQTQSFLEGVGYRGCVGIGHRYDARDGRYKLLDVNARVSGVFRLFRATNGMDVVRICYLDLTGQPVVDGARLTVGRKWLLEDDVFVAREAIAEGKLTVRQWLRSLAGVREAQWLAFHDPIPFFAWAADNVRRAIAKRRSARA